MRTAYLLAAIIVVTASCRNKHRTDTELVVLNTDNLLEITHARDSFDRANKVYYYFTTIKNNRSDSVLIQLTSKIYDEDDKQIGVSSTNRTDKVAPGQSLVFKSERKYSDPHFFPYKVTVTAEDITAVNLAYNRPYLPPSTI